MKVKSVVKHSYFIVTMEDDKTYRYVPEYNSSVKWGKWFLEFEGSLVQVLNQEKIKQLKDAYIEHAEIVSGFGVYQ